MPAITPQQAYELALSHHRAGQVAQAEAIYRQILAVQPDHAGALEHLGVVAQQTGHYDLAVEWLGRAVAIDSQNAATQSNLGEAYRAMGRLDEAVACYRRAIDLQPDFPEPHNNLANAFWAAGKFENAVTASRRALELRPDYPEAHISLGNALTGLGQLDEAIAAYRRALELQPAYHKFHNNLASAFWEQGRLDEAVASYRRLLESAPHNPGAHSNLIRTLHYLPGDSARLIAAEQERWNHQFGRPPGGDAPAYPNSRDPDRRLRIGYVSPDFWDHVVGRYLLPLFRHHDRAHFEVVCYSGVLQADGMTEGFRQHAALWRNTVGVPDDTLAQTIREDQIDILVDLSQHTGGNRLPVFARRPAPVQVSYGGYPESAGVEAIPYRISDGWLEAGGVETEMQISEPVLNLPKGPPEQVFLIDSFWCFDPCGVKIAVNGLPATKNGLITFGSLNSFSKINAPALRLWARILCEVGASRLVLLSGLGSHRQRTVEFLAQEGIAENRIEFVERRPREAYLELYHRLDVTLDPFPYGGHTSSLDSLWMGVPVVSLAGKAPVSRGGLSILNSAGLPELVARTEDDYVRLATNLANDLPRLGALRAGLRSRIEKSVLMDAPHLTRQIEAAYRQMWRQWCLRGAG